MCEASYVGDVGARGGGKHGPLQQGLGRGVYICAVEGSTIELHGAPKRIWDWVGWNNRRRHQGSYSR